MEYISTVPKNVHNQLAKLEAEMHELRAAINELTLSADDLTAIQEGQKDFEKGKTQRL